MSFSRRKFMKLAAALSGAAVAPRAGAEITPLVHDQMDIGFRPALLPSQKESWDQLVWMAKLGPKYTGNPAHVQFVDYLAKNLQSCDLEVQRDHYTLPRWEARRCALDVHTASGASLKLPVTSYYPYSGETRAEGVTGEIAYLGTFQSIYPDVANHTQGPGSSKPTAPPVFSQDLKDKIVFVECPVLPTNMREWFRVRGGDPVDITVSSALQRTHWGTVGVLTDFKKAGALGVILGWTNISDENAADQYAPFSRPHQDIPGIYIGRESTAKLKDLAASGAKATLVLEANITPDSPTDTLYSLLPGTSTDEIITVQTHTDGPNALEENGGIAILALARYFSKIPKAERKRTLLFVLTTGHFALPYVGSIRAFIEKHPDLIKKTVASVTIEHVGGLEWADDELMHYRPTGKNELALAQVTHDSVVKVLQECLKDSGDDQTAILTPNPGHRWAGEGGAVNQTGVPEIGYIVIPNYLCAGPANGCIERLSPDRMHAEIAMFAKVIHKYDAMSTAELRGEQG
jgi:hypothetical protein